MFIFFMFLKYSHVLIHFNLQGLGKLAVKFPNIASTSINCLRDFLVKPSPILIKLHKLATERSSKDKFKITGTFGL